MSHKTKIYHVVAMARNRVIGQGNKLPWHFPEDLKQFKKTTLGSTVIMGRKTYESIGRPLPGRENFVISRTLGQVQGIHVFRSVGNAIGAVTTENAFIIGGAEIYRSTIQSVDGIYLTRIDQDYDGDAFYPEIPDDFEEIEIQALREKAPKIEVVFYEREPGLQKHEAPIHELL